MAYHTGMKAILLPLAFMPAAIHGAVLTGSVNTDPGHLTSETAVDLTASGTRNWVAWDFRSGDGTAPTRAPSNTIGPALAPGTASYVSGLTGVGGATGNLQGSGTLGATFFTYSNGVDPTSLSPAVKIGTAFNSTLDTTGTGMSFTVTGDPSQLYRVSVWATGFNGQGTLTASLNGATSLPLVTQTFVNGKAPVLFTIDFQPDSATDLLNLSYLLTTDTANGSGTTGKNSHVAIQAVTVEAIPEPSAAMVLAGALGLLGLRRRRA